jgi:hypothetical protein
LGIAFLGQGPSQNAIRARLLNFYREDRANRWPDVLSHFTVGKISARWPAPTLDSTWIAAVPPREEAPCASQNRAPPSRMSITVIGLWARVFVTWCDRGSTDEVWLLRISDDWKIARLMRDIPRLPTPAAR